MSKILNKFEARLAEMKKALNPEITEKLEFYNIRNKRIMDIVGKIEGITNKKVREQFAYRSGWTFGIMNHICQNPTVRQQLLNITGLNEALIQMYFEFAGNLPYIDKNGILQEGRPQVPNKCKALIQTVATILGYYYEDSELEDISQERWDFMYKKRMEEIRNTMTLCESNITYEE